MKIWSQYRPGIYWIDPATFGPEDSRGRRTLDPGLKVEFTTLGGVGAGSLLDTEEMGWDEATRERVERWMQDSHEWGFTLFFADDSVTQRRIAGAVCKVMTAQVGGVRACGRPVEEEGQLCDIHAPQRQVLEAREHAAFPPPPPEPVEAKA